jgi:hypothetical protein
MDIVKDTNLAIRFLLELGTLAALGFWGYRLGDAGLARLALAIGIPLGVAVVWGTFLSPKASVPLPDALTLLMQLAILGTAAWALVRTGQEPLAAIFGGIVIVNTALMLVWHQ